MIISVQGQTFQKKRFPGGKSKGKFELKPWWIGWITLTTYPYHGVYCIVKGQSECVWWIDELYTSFFWHPTITYPPDHLHIGLISKWSKHATLPQVVLRPFSSSPRWNLITWDLVCSGPSRPITGCLSQHVRPLKVALFVHKINDHKRFHIIFYDSVKRIISAETFSIVSYARTSFVISVRRVSLIGDGSIQTPRKAAYLTYVHTVVSLAQMVKTATSIPLMPRVRTRVLLFWLQF